ncbi:MAG: hypothetical protein QXU75_09670, partial [Candidatus Methanomethylicaceae archaeon]
MPRKGYKSITVPEDLYRKLLELAERYGTTSQKLIESLLDFSTIDGKDEVTASAATVTNIVINHKKTPIKIAVSDEKFNRHPVAKLT